MNRAPDHGEVPLSDEELKDCVLPPDLLAFDQPLVSVPSAPEEVCVSVCGGDVGRASCFLSIC